VAGRSRGANEGKKTGRSARNDRGGDDAPATRKRQWCVATVSAARGANEGQKTGHSARNDSGLWVRLEMTAVPDSA